MAVVSALSRIMLGRTGIEVSRLCFGTLTMSPLQRNFSPEQGAELLLYAYEKGVSFLDTADLYETYPHIRLALKRGAEYTISTKAYCYDEATAEAALERCFRGIGREYVDVFLLHEQESLYTLRGHEPALKYLARQKQLGRIGAIGISTHYVAAARAALRFPEIEVLHPLINVRGIGIQDGSREDMEAAVRLASERGLGIYGMKALGGGHLMRNNEQALQYILGLDALHSVAVGMQSFQEIDANVARFSGAPTAEALLKSVGARDRHVMVHDYCEGCGRCRDRCGQKAIDILGGRAVVNEDRCVYCGYCAEVCPQFCIKVV